MPTVGTLIAQKRSELDMTQRELARALGTSQPALCRYETGESLPTDETIKRIATELGINWRYLVLLAWQERVPDWLRVSPAGSVLQHAEKTD